MPATPETILAFDFGRRRIGVAVGQSITRSASPLGVVKNGDDGPDWQRLESILREWQPGRLVVGMPLNADGSPSELSQHARSFADDLARFDIPVHTTDERYSSLEAESLLKSQRASGLRGRISKDMVDSSAAMLIAERWLKAAPQSE